MSTGKEVLNRLLSSEIKGDLLVLFHKNPGLIDTVEGVARRIGRTQGAVETDLKDLVDLGILRRKRVGKSEAISLNRARDQEIQEIVANHIRSLKMGKGV